MSAVVRSAAAIFSLWQTHAGRIMTSPHWAQFTDWHQQNQTGGLRCIWRRRAVWHAQLMQKIGLHRQIAAPLFWGERMNVVTGEVVSSSILAFGYAEPTITALMLAVLEQGQTFVDVGTHFGYEAMLASELVGSTGHVVCFEPHSLAFAVARRNLSRLQQAIIVREPIADHSEYVHFEELPLERSAFSPVRADQTAATVTMRATTLDDACARLIPTLTVDFVKCDVEGLELQVLRGAKRVLTVDRPVVVLEADMPSSDGQLSERAWVLEKLLSEHDYCGMNFDFDGTLRAGPIGSFPVFHANVAFIPRHRADLLARFGLS